jgi:hypothetical protein
LHHRDRNSTASTSRNSFQERVFGRSWPQQPIPKSLDANAGNAVPDDVTIHFDGGPLEIALEMCALSEMRPDASDHRSDHLTLTREDITLDDAFDPCFATENQLTGALKAASNPALDTRLTENRDLALEKTSAWDQRNSRRSGRCPTIPVRIVGDRLGI